MHEDDLAHYSRLINRYPNLTPTDLEEWADKPLFVALKAYDSKRFWVNCEKASAIVDKWPDWMKGSRVNRRTQADAARTQPTGEQWK